MTPHAPHEQHGFTDRIVRTFLHSNLSAILLIVSVALGAAALFITPREEDPQIVVPLADVYVRYPGHSAAEVEQLVATPLERILYQIDGVEYVYSMSKPDEAVITVRFYVGQDRERSLVKLFKKIDEHVDIVPPGVTGWVIKPVEIDDVPIVALTLTGKTSARTASIAPERQRGLSSEGATTQATESSSAAPDEYALRRVAEELADRLAAVKDVSRVNVVGGQARVVSVWLSAARLRAYQLSPLEVAKAIQASNVTMTAGDFDRDDILVRVEAGRAIANTDELTNLVVGVFGDRPVFLRDVARVEDGAEEASSYVRFGWGPAHGFSHQPEAPGEVVGEEENSQLPIANSEGKTHTASPNSLFAIRNSPLSSPAVTIALAKKKGSNAVAVAKDVIATAETLRHEVVPDDVQLVVTRNYGVNADEKVNELVEALGVAVLIVIALLAISLGWREGLIVAVAVPVVFGLTLTVNLLMGYTINRVTLFALILSLGLLVDDPIVDVENIARHFALRGKATREIVRDAVSEIRPPLITATLAVIVSFLPMFFITGMMGPYMAPMALNVPIAMFMSMVVAFTITPWLSFHVLGRGRGAEGSRGRGAEASTRRGVEESRSQGAEGQRREGVGSGESSGAGTLEPSAPRALESSDASHDLEALKRSFLYRLFYPLMAPLLRSRPRAWIFLGVIGLLTIAATSLAALRVVPLKMLPFDNKNEILLVLDMDEGTTLERTDAATRDFEHYLTTQPEVASFVSYVGLASPMDFNGLVRHYYLRRGDNVADIRVNLVHKKNRHLQSHGLTLRMRDELTALAQRLGANLKIVELPPGPPVIASVVAEIYGRPDQTYGDLAAAAHAVRARLAREPGVVDVDDMLEAPQQKLTFVVDKEKAALSGVSTDDVARTLQMALGGSAVDTLQVPRERQPLRIELRLPQAARSSVGDLSQVFVKGRAGELVPLAEIGTWAESRVDQTIYHKNLQRVVYVFAETAGRPPADAVVDLIADRADTPAGRTHAWLYGKTLPTAKTSIGSGWVEDSPPRSPQGRTFLLNGGGIRWFVPEGIRVDFAGEGEWKITLDVFRDLGLAFGAAMVGIYVLLVAQTKSFTIPVIVMLAIPLTILGVMPGFWLLNALTGQTVGGYANPVFFTATGMIGMIALAGIVTRDAIILVDFIHLSLRKGRTLFDAIMESRVVRLRPILLTASAAMLGAAPITIDPIFSGLAWALIFGLFASTVFTLFVIPVVYWLLYANTPGHGLSIDDLQN